MFLRQVKTAEFKANFWISNINPKVSFKLVAKITVSDRLISKAPRFNRYFDCDCFK